MSDAVHCLEDVRIRLASNATEPKSVEHSVEKAGRSKNSGPMPLIRTNNTTHGESFQHAILIVEDDKLLQLLTVDIVETAGFVAVHADNADEAVAILEARSDIALLLTDINMPGSMDGLILAHAVRDRWPLIKIIIVSSQIPKSDLPTDSRFLAKPYLGEKLIAEVRLLIEAQSQCGGAEEAGSGV